MVDDNPADEIQQSAITLQNKNAHKGLIPGQNAFNNVIAHMTCPIEIYQSDGNWAANAYYQDPALDPTFEGLQVHIYDQTIMNLLSNMADPSTDSVYAEGFMNTDGSCTVIGPWRKKFSAIVKAGTQINPGQYSYGFTEYVGDATTQLRTGQCLNFGEWNDPNSAITSDYSTTDQADFIAQPYIGGGTEITEEIDFTSGSFIYTFFAPRNMKAFND